MSVKVPPRSMAKDQVRLTNRVQAECSRALKAQITTPNFMKEALKRFECGSAPMGTPAWCQFPSLIQGRRPESTGSRVNADLQAPTQIRLPFPFACAILSPMGRMGRPSGKCRLKVQFRYRDGRIEGVINPAKEGAACRRTSAQLPIMDSEIATGGPTAFPSAIISARSIARMTCGFTSLAANVKHMLCES